MTLPSTCRGGCWRSGYEYQKHWRDRGPRRPLAVIMKMCSGYKENLYRYTLQLTRTRSYLDTGEGRVDEVEIDVVEAEISE